MMLVELTRPGRDMSHREDRARPRVLYLSWDAAPM